MELLLRIEEVGTSCCLMLLTMGKFRQRGEYFAQSSERNGEGMEGRIQPLGTSDLSGISILCVE